MIKLFATKQNESTAIQLDVLENENINISYSVDDIKEAGAKNSSYSKDFRLPATKHNNSFFEHFNNLDRYTINYNPNLVLKAFLEVNGSILIDGFLQVLAVDKKNNEYFYKVVIYDDTSNLFETLADDTVADLTLSGIGHTKYKFNFNVNTGATDPNVNYDNMVFSWDAAGIYTDNMAQAPAVIVTGDRTNDIFYPLVYNDTVAEDLFGYNVALRHAQNYPISIKLKKLIDEIFSHAGYTFDSTFFDSDDFNNIYFLPPILQQFLNTDDIDPVAATGIATPGTTIGNTNATAYTIICDTEGSDPDNEYNLATGVFTAATDYHLYVSFTGVIKITTPAIASQISLIAEVTNDDIIPDGQYVIDTVGGLGVAVAPQFRARTFTGGIAVSEGAIVTFKLRAEGNITYEIAEQEPTIGAALNSPFAFLNINRYNLITPADKIRELCKDIKLVDIIKDCFKMFNLVVETTNTTKTLKIETYNDFVNLYDTLDWSEKIDLQEAKITPIKTVKSVQFAFAQDGDDFYLEQYKTDYNRNYGDLNLLVNPDADKEVKIQLEVFAPAYTEITAEMQNPIGVTLQSGKEQDDTITSFANKPRLFYKNPLPSFYGAGVTLYDAELILYNAPNEILEQDTFSSGSIYNASAFNINNNTNSLIFGNVNDYTNLLGVAPVNTLFNRFYFDYIKERYDNANNFIYTAKIYLTASDVKNFSFGNKIRIKSQLYRVNTIKYNTSENKLSTIELLRI